MDQKGILEGLQTGDEHAFRMLVDEYQLMVVNTCKGFVHDLSDAEDLAQEVFIEVFRSASKFRGDSKISTWIYRIAVNKSLNFVRDNKRKKFFQSIENNLFGSKKLDIPAPHVTDQPDLEIENNQRKQNLYRAIDGLPETQRTAFSLSKFDDLSYREIAEVMGLSVASVESLIHRAKLNLQKKLFHCYKKGI